ncbi:MAG: LytTR family transcriptional regulator [Lachnospiraceae bacterium]|nr:LytTR family transcriptional regulator [Lachnospiraceae bacterium]
MAFEKNWQDGMVKLTVKILKEHYKRNLDFVLSYIAEEFIWIGPLKCQFVSGKEEFRKMLEPEQKIPVLVSEVDFRLVSRQSDSCVVAGSLLATTADKSGLILSVYQRYTFCWSIVDGTPKVCHIHGSNPWEFTDENETFPFQTGKLTYQYMEKMCRQRQRKLTFLDINKNEIYIEENKIIYAEAQKRHCMIYSTDGEFEVGISISALENLFSTQFYRTHRSFLVNVNYIIRVQRYEILLCDQIRLPIPEKRYGQIKKEIREIEESLIIV